MFIKSDKYTIVFVLIVTFIADIALIVFGIQDNTFKLSLAIAGVITILIIVLCLFYRKEGLLIENDKLCYISMRKKYFEINQIAGLHIVKEQIPLGRFISIDLKVKGEYKYKIIYLKDRDFKINNSDNGVRDFWIHHAKHILFVTVYDEKVIEYFKSKGIGITGNIQ